MRGGDGVYSMVYGLRRIYALHASSRAAYWSLPGRCNFLRIGSKTKGVSCPPCGPAPVPFGASILEQSTSRAMAFRNALAYGCHQNALDHYEDAGLATYRLGMPPPATPLKPTQMSSSTGRAYLMSSVSSTGGVHANDIKVLPTTL